MVEGKFWSSGFSALSGRLKRATNMPKWRYLWVDRCRRFSFFGVNDLINWTFEHGHYNYSSGLTKGNFLYTTIFDIQVSISGVLRGQIEAQKGGFRTSDLQAVAEGEERGDQ